MKTGKDVFYPNPPSPQTCDNMVACWVWVLPFLFSLLIQTYKFGRIPIIFLIYFYINIAVSFILCFVTCFFHLINTSHTVLFLCSKSPKGWPWKSLHIPHVHTALPLSSLISVLRCMIYSHHTGLLGNHEACWHFRAFDFYIYCPQYEGFTLRYVSDFFSFFFLVT